MKFIAERAPPEMPRANKFEVIISKLFFILTRIVVVTRLHLLVFLQVLIGDSIGIELLISHLILKIAVGVLYSCAKL